VFWFIALAPPLPAFAETTVPAVFDSAADIPLTAHGYNAHGKFPPTALSPSP
jgi:hypothetical protein